MMIQAHGSYDDDHSWFHSLQTKYEMERYRLANTWLSRKKQEVITKMKAFIDFDREYNN